MIPRAQLRNLARAGLAALALALLFALSLHVNGLKSQVRRAELQIVALKHEKLYLETEFETRANQQRLQAWNEVDFGYVAPGPGQFVEDGRELADLGRLPQPVPAGAPASRPEAPVRLAQRAPEPAASARPNSGSRHAALTRDRAVVTADAKAVPAKAKALAKLEKAARKAPGGLATKPPAKLAKAEKSRPNKSQAAPERPREVAVLDVRQPRPGRGTPPSARLAAQAVDKSKEERGR